MKQKGKKLLAAGLILLAAFILWTLLIMTVDVQAIGPRETKVGFAALNGWFHRLTGDHMTIYTVTDWLGLVPILICCVFGVLGLVQWIRRKRLLKVDADILLLGVYYVLVILAYLVFEMIPINYRPVLIEGRLEASYPSSTTLLVLSVMPTLVFQAKRRVKTPWKRHALVLFAALFSVFMVVGRTVAGVHWLTDIAGAGILSAALYLLYKASALLLAEKKSGTPECDT